MMPVEFLFMAIYLVVLGNWAKKSGTDPIQARRLRLWISGLLILFVIFTVLVYVMDAGFMTIFGALYLVILGAVAVITIRMRDTVNQAG